MTALKRTGSRPLDILSRDSTDSHTRVWRGTLGSGEGRGGEGWRGNGNGKDKGKGVERGESE